jgi:aspartate aminotransferase
MPKESATLFAAKVVAERKSKGLPVYNFGLGACPVPAPACMVKALCDNASMKNYTPSTGYPEFRKKLLEVYDSAADVLVGNGVKPLLYILFMMWQGRIVIPTPAWVSYIEQAKLLNKEYLLIEGTLDNQYKLTPESVRKHCTKNDLVVFTHPNNPTGAVYSESELKELSVAFRETGVTVVADEIYLRLAYKPARSLADFYPERTLRTSSLSKEVGCGGWRCGWVTFPEACLEYHASCVATASSVYSCSSHNLQACAKYMLDYPPEVMEHIESTRVLFSQGAEIVYNKLSPILDCTVPKAAWYIWVSFERFRDKLNKQGILTGEDLTRTLATELGVVAVPGEAFGVSGLAMRMSFVDIDVPCQSNNPWGQVIAGLDVMLKWLKEQ